MDKRCEPFPEKRALKAVGHQPPGEEEQIYCETPPLTSQTGSLMGLIDPFGLRLLREEEFGKTEPS